MPKRILGITLAIAALAFAGCGNTNPLLGTTATPTPVPATPNPTITAAIVKVYASSSPLPNQPVGVSTPDTTGHAGTAFATQLTNASGIATFNNLTGAATYCFTTTYVPPSPTLSQTQSQCTQFWGNGLTFNF